MRLLKSAIRKLSPQRLRGTRGWRITKTYLLKPLLFLFILLSLIPVVFDSTDVTSQGGGGTTVSITITATPAFATGLPVVDVLSATNVEYDTATLWGEVLDCKGTIGIRGFMWDTSCKATPGNSTAPSGSVWTNYWTEAGSWGNGTFSHDITGLLGNTTYFVMAAAHNADGWGYSSCGNFTTSGSSCDCPTTLVATKMSDNKVQLDWSGGVSTSGYLVKRAFGEAPSLGNGTTVYAGTGLSAIDYVDLSMLVTTVYYTVWADCGNGSYSVCYATAELEGGITVIYLGLFGLALGLTWFAFRGRYVLWNIAAAVSWIALWAYMQTNPPSGFAEGSAGHTIIVLVPIAAAVAIMLYGLGREVTTQKKFGDSESGIFQRFQMRKWDIFDSDEDETGKGEQGLTGMDKRNAGYRSRMRRAFRNDEED